MSVWDDPEIREGGAFVKFENVGDTVSGTVTAVRSHRFDDGKVAPQILLTTDDGEERTVTAGQVRLKAALAEKRPEAGDHLTVTFTQNEKRAGGKTLKHFEVTVRRNGTAVAAPAPAVEPAPITAGPSAVGELVKPAAVDQALWDVLGPEQKAKVVAAAAA
ncbi:hypothetical protein ABZ793_12080 [Micromonospora sp. NPDC047465]|uniref:hypothetical protein n=1 Tax=Micromonospora sp. NPDC047465 TaxID=3154813 RepID=UPI0033E1F603